MPYKSEKIIIKNTQYDRRVKLTDEDKEQIIWLYENTDTSQRKLAKQFSVTRGAIRYIVNPKALERHKELAKQRRATGRYKPTKDKHAEVTREYRHYKQSLFKEGKI